ncbi:Phosphatidylinositol/phosphatidylcholine transfer protein SFH11 [Zancudomyces culisetae]|uniref:Phosphatidylinositol/phosphatidylcholine transfer protein SFH11 n=1 Tax=Zancudomyces culisetae TaxID=1213189 RepID=A0A1R1PUM1_ZANCU|nr:Phosphatidylinositol/phosphatidylcholine transfer protein SFH11 [Zancudomyces culisetae]|eukprot:OMH84637.1 Phosphatidylinositol/phosphatidylcholine transfer protein SFH11 [Zancudomyces culisetae]
MRDNREEITADNMEKMKTEIFTENKAENVDEATKISAEITNNNQNNKDSTAKKSFVNIGKEETGKKETIDTVKGSQKIDMDAMTESQKAQVIRDVREALPQDINEKCSDMNKAKDMIINWQKWRVEQKINDLPVPRPDNDYSIPYPIRGYVDFADANLTPGKDIKDTQMIMNNLYGGGCYHKRDKLGHPLYIDRMGLYELKKITSQCTLPELTRIHNLFQEFATQSLTSDCSKATGKQIYKQTVIFDLSGMGFSMLYWPALNMIKDTVEGDQYYFPESMHKTYIVNAPSVFVAIWNIVKTWMDPRTLEKIYIGGKNFKEVLLNDIDADCLPSFLGGTCNCAHMPGGCVPCPPKGNYLNLPRADFTNLEHRTSLGYKENHSFTTTFKPELETPVEKPKVDTNKTGSSQSWFGLSKKSKEKSSNENGSDDAKYIIVRFFTDGGRGLVFEALWTPLGSSSSESAILIYPEMLFETQRGPIALEIMIPKEHPLGEMTLNFRVPRFDEGSARYPNEDEYQKPITLVYGVDLEEDLRKKYNLPPVNRAL